MLSVCIPIYNINVGTLVEGLLQEVSTLSVPCEIILVDDNSQLCRDENSKLASTNVSYTRLEQNIGRAAIRNRFLSIAKYDYLLFLDCDALLISSKFLSAYAAELKRGEKVVCGGRVYSSKHPARNKMLHWKYGKYRESQPAPLRMRNPCKSFMTNNFMIERRTLETIKFDERLSGYGHEDTLFGYELKKRGIAIKHIDNPILHGELQTNKEFLEKTENGVSNLKKVLTYVNNDKAFIEDVTLLRYYFWLKRHRLIFAFNVIFLIKRPFIKIFLLSGYGNMAYFNLYKLGCFINT